MLVELLTDPLVLTPLVLSAISGLAVIWYGGESLENKFAQDHLVRIILILVAVFFGAGSLLTINFNKNIETHFQNFTTNVNNNFQEATTNIESTINKNIETHFQNFTTNVNNNFQEATTNIENTINKYYQEINPVDNDIHKVPAIAVNQVATCLDEHDKKSGKYLRAYSKYLECEKKNEASGNGTSNCKEPDYHMNERFKVCLNNLRQSN